MQTRELTKKEWKEVLSRFAVKPGEKTVREFANEEGGLQCADIQTFRLPGGGRRSGEGERGPVCPS